MYRPPEFSIERPDMPPDLQARYDAALTKLNETAVRRDPVLHGVPVTPFTSAYSELVAQLPAAAPPLSLCGLVGCCHPYEHDGPCDLGPCVHLAAHAGPCSWERT